MTNTEFDAFMVNWEADKVRRKVANDKWRAEQQAQEARREAERPVLDAVMAAIDVLVAMSTDQARAAKDDPESDYNKARREYGRWLKEWDEQQAREAEARKTRERLLRELTRGLEASVITLQSVDSEQLMEASKVQAFTKADGLLAGLIVELGCPMQLSAPNWGFAMEAWTRGEYSSLADLRRVQRDVILESLQ